MIFTILRKEIESYFSSPLAYVVIGLFSLISGVIFYNLIVTYADGIRAIPGNYAANISFVNEVVLRLFANLNFLMLFFVPLITMRSFSEERRQGTLDIYWLSPLRDWQIVVAKSLASLVLIAAMLTMTIVYPLVIWGVGVEDFTVLGPAYLALALNCAGYVSLGLFCSSLSSNQIISALSSVLAILAFWMITWGGHLNSNYLISEILIYIGITSHFERILRGLIGTQDLIYYVTLIGFFGFLTVKSLGRRNW